MAAKKTQTSVHDPKTDEPNWFNLFEVPAGLLFAWAVGNEMHGHSYTSKQAHYLAMGVHPTKLLFEALNAFQVDLKAVQSSPAFSRLSGGEATTFAVDSETFWNGQIRFECNKADDQSVSELSQEYGVPVEFVVATATACGIVVLTGMPDEVRRWAVRWITALVTATLESRQRKIVP